MEGMEGATNMSSSSGSSPFPVLAFLWEEKRWKTNGGKEKKGKIQKKRV